MGVLIEERGVRVGFIHACGLKALRFGAVAKDFKNEYMQVSQAVHAALLADPVAGAWADRRACWFFVFGLLLFFPLILTAYFFLGLIRQGIY